MMKSGVSTRLLVVHADDDLRTFMRRRFTRLGHEVMEAGEHARVLALVATVPFDLVLLDLQTPGRDGQCGLDLLRRIRETRTAAELPILAIAGDMASEEAVEALALGADDCLVRPLQIGVTNARVEMLIRRRHELSATDAAGHNLATRLELLQDATVRSEAVSAGLVELGLDPRARLTTLVSAAGVLTSICRTPQLKPAIESIDGAVAALDSIIGRALGHADRRIRAPKAKVNVLLADDDASSRFSVREVLHATEVTVELVEVAAGLEAALATDTRFFDLIVMNVAAPEAMAGIRAIRRAERQNLTRRTPILALGAQRRGAAEALHAGADLYLGEPVTGEHLLGSLAAALARESEDMCAVA